MTDREQHIINKLHIEVTTNSVSNEFLVQLIELGGMYLNLMSIPEYAAENGLSYNGVKKCRNIQTILKHKWVIDNT